MPDGPLLINLFMIVLLIAATAFFVAAEFAVVKVRPSRIQQLINEGHKQGQNAQAVIGNLDEYLSACQLGITLTALGLGWLGKPTVSALFYPLLTALDLSPKVIDGISFIIGFSVISFLHVVVGELAPKSIAIQRAEQITLALSGLLIIFYKIMYPAIWLLNGSARAILHAMGYKVASEHSESHTEEEIRMIMMQSHRSGEIEEAELELANKVFQMTEKVATEIMVPRTEMVCLFLNLPVEENLKVIQVEQYGRYPVCDTDKDHIVGYAVAKDMLKPLLTQGKISSILEYVREPLTVYEFTPLIEVLKLMQKTKKQMAIVLDEYGGTAGLVTIEDVLEEIVGEIQDEYDVETPPILITDKGIYSIDSRVAIADVNQALEIHLESEDVYTIGGWFMTQTQGELDVGVSFVYENLKFTAIESEETHLLRIQIEKCDPVVQDLEA